MGEQARIIVPGSSPLSRGIPQRHVSQHGRPWIIPALAGNTFAYYLHIHHPRDHPRSRGEYLVMMVCSFFGLGSSPLSRGIPIRSAPSPPDIGIIPALAGNTHSSASPCPGHRDHPRSRGEYGHSGPRGAMGAGSSPLSRGIRWSRRHDQGWQGIIPALAGNTGQ